ncbi:hypothetical protein [Pedobacter frigiditerrae]|uniref:hypothetical protein n=1 Tax=Pedobacter frigiditerrae TaxID=2530452 RepID=UPI00292FAFCE|nr:hypothetical protein [Pedobacter frigiditerrae]
MLEEKLSITNQNIEPQYIISLNKFIFLSVITFGLYIIWWFYKAWRFFQEKENTDIMPALRTIFGIFFLIRLFSKIIDFAKAMNYQKNYSPNLLFIGYLLTILLSYLPEPYGLISISGFGWFIKPFKALNYAKLNDSGYEVILQDRFNTRQIFLIVVGSIWWLLILASIAIILSQQNEYIAY